MLRPHPRSLLLALGSLAVLACGEDSTPTQPMSGSESVTAAPLVDAFTPNTWTLKAAPSNGAFVNQASAGVMNDASGQPVVYLLGGRDDDGGTGSPVLTYRVATNIWASKGPEPKLDVFNSNGVGRIGNLLYISGGENFAGGSFQTDDRFWAYNPVTNTLTQKPDPPKITSEGVTGVIDGKLYVLPGRCSFDFFPNPGYCEVEPFRRLFRYNPATNAWATRKPAPHFHTLGAGGVISGKFYAAGGEGTKTLDRYDPATDSWKTLAPLPVGGTARGAVMQGKFYVVVTNYNSTLGKYVFNAFAYNPGTNGWTRKAAPKWTHSDIVAITWNGKPHLVAVGGIHEPGPQSNPVELYTP
jgi:N-acetylneuraminic acid mutarotase